MPASRPYASRGVPRLATTRQTGSRFPLRGGRALLAAVLLLSVGTAVTLNASAFGVRGAASPPEVIATAVAGGLASGAGPVGWATPGADSPGALAADATPGAVDLRPLATPPPTSRRWQTSAPNMTVDPFLASQLDQALLGVDGHVGIVVKDLGSGRGAVLDGDLELQAASLYKLPVLYTVFDLGLSMNEDLLITPDALAYDSGTMELGAGETLTVAEALERMVTLSDNTAAVMLGSRVGAGRINAEMAGLGMDTTHYGLERMTASARDMLHLVELMARGQAVSRAASADMLHLMLRQRVNDRLPRLLPDDVQVAHKTGNLPGIVNDVGILYSPTSTVAVAAMVSDTTDETAAATAIARIGLIANSYFDGQPEVKDRPLIPPAPSRPIPPVWREPRPVPTSTPTEVPVDAAVVDSATPTATAAAGAVRVTSTLVPPTPTAMGVSPPSSAPAARPTSPPATATPPLAPPTATPVPPQPTKPPPRTVAPTATTAPARRSS